MLKMIPIVLLLLFCKQSDAQVVLIATDKTNEEIEQSFTSVGLPFILVAKVGQGVGETGTEAVANAKADAERGILEEYGKDYTITSESIIRLVELDPHAHKWFVCDYYILVFVWK